ncbi:acyl-CoA dehydrogenase [Mycobacterium sp. E2327]|uniref:acyl-CoA dehydrogenase family protein n=1 Tax=Mycobacterium sp. E2327 TaxID=1834132 RepID=UPI00080110A2|nr:acyl-CoA dehydrogenase family protein [Mycobacterium sp. E2327]OBI15733.1 acyl-CoA dehydrogenase [Mycobacterium sp. E2327]
MRRTLFEADHEDFRATVREFVSREVLPNLEMWDRDRLIGRETWHAAGKLGLFGIAVPEEYGGGGLADYRFRCVIMEELARANAAALANSFTLQDDVVLPYLLSLANEKQQQRWLRGMATGDIIGAIAMTEPAAGSDLQGIRSTAVRDGDEWVLNGSKTFISNGINSDIVIVLCRTNEGRSSTALSLLVVERDMPGFERGRKLRKLGLNAQDTAELFFTDVRVPAANLLGEEGKGFGYLMTNLPVERISVAYQALAASRAAIAWTLEYIKERTAFGKSLSSFQNTQFEIADMVTKLDVFETYMDKSVTALNAGELTPVDAAKGKYLGSELQKEIVDRCLQLFGGYGYMLEYPIARAYADARVQTIYGGTSEIMKTIIGRDVIGKC